MSFQMWEKAIELSKQLAKMHESHMFDFVELSRLLVRRCVHCNSIEGLMNKSQGFMLCLI